MKHLIALLLLCTPLGAIEITPANPVPPYTQVHVRQSTEAEWITVDPVLESPLPAEFLEDGADLDVLFPELLKTVAGDYVFTGRPGLYIVRGRTEQSGVVVGVQRLVRIGTPAPTPTPVPPGPVPPTPVPPGPDTVPFPAAGLTVMIVREASPTEPVPASQAAIFSSSRLQQWLNTNTLKIDNGPAWRLWDDDMTDAHLVNVPEPLRIAYRATVQQAAGKQPWIAVSNGVSGFSGPLPATVDETLALLQRFQ